MSDARDERPRPQYGEYATPEEQAARIREPLPDAVPVVPPATETPTPAASTAAGPRRAGLGNLVATVLLLGYGLMNVLSQIPQFLDLGALVAQLSTVMRVSLTLADPSSVRGWGIAAAVVVSVGWLATAALCTARLRRGRSAWWIALVAGIVLQLVVAVLVVAGLSSDSGIRDALLSVAR